MDKLGIELPLLLTQILNFAILMVVLTKFLYKPILKVIKERQEKIEESLQIVEKTKVEAQRWEVKKQELLKEVREEARAILETAKKEGKQLKDEQVIQGKKELITLKEKMEKELDAKEVDLTAQISAHTVDIASSMVRRLLVDVLTDKEQHILIGKQLEKLQKTYEKR